MTRRRRGLQRNQISQDQIFDALADALDRRGDMNAYILAVEVLHLYEQIDMIRGWLAERKAAREEEWVP